MRKAPFLLLCSLSAACERDPSFFGYWDIARIERGGETQSDAGFFEILDDGSIALFLRYEWSGGLFAPDPRPEVLIGSTSQTESEFGEGYQEKGETYTLWLSLFGETPFDVVEYKGDRARLESDTAAWPTPDLPAGVNVSGDLSPTALVLRR